VRCGSVKRVGAAIGEGAAVVAQLHTFLARRYSSTSAVATVQTRFKGSSALSSSDSLS
jgi:hypothetical protein